MTWRRRLTATAAALLAVAVGIVLGSVLLPPPGDRPATSATQAAQQELRRTTKDADAFAAAAAPRLVAGSLTGQRVLLVLAPGAPDPARAAALLARAGATVAGTVRLLPDLLAPGEAQTVDDVVAAVPPAGVTLPQSSAIARAGAALGAVLLDSRKGVNATADEREQVLAAFTGAELISAATPPTPATAVLVLTGPDPTQEALVSLALSFRDRVGVVVGVPTGAKGPVLTGLRTGTQVSTVTGTGGLPGLVGAVLALAEQVRGGTGHYGTGPGTTALLPLRAP